MAYIRTSCVVCSNTEFETINTFTHYPIMAISNNSVTEHYYEYTLIACTNCKCLQLKYLVDPSILYSDVYMNATFTPSWADHHAHFSKFILDHTAETKFLEVGANKGDLYLNMSKEREVEFTTLDMFKHKDLPEKITFLEGNCETFDFTGISTIILSHVFEHLYSPHTFIENIRRASVATVFISIPNFDLLLKEQSLLILYSQHTFFCGFDYIVYMFSLHNYRCVSSYIYDGPVKSTMFTFVLDTTMMPLGTPSTNIQLYREIFIDKIQRIQNIDIPPNSYIMPSGVYGQLYYYHIKNKENIRGFLDNNAQRHKNKLYGTDKVVCLPSSIEYGTVLVCDCPYKKEIIAGLKQLCASIEILCI